MKFYFYTQEKKFNGLLKFKLSMKRSCGEILVRRKLEPFRLFEWILKNKIIENQLYSSNLLLFRFVLEPLKYKEKLEYSVKE